MVIKNINKKLFAELQKAESQPGNKKLQSTKDEKDIISEYCSKYIILLITVTYTCNLGTT